MEKEKVLTFTEWCINLSNDILSSKNKEDLKIKEELKNLVHDEPGEKVPRGTNNQAFNLSSESEEFFWRDIAKKINTGIVLMPIKPKDFKGSYGDYIKEFEKKASNLHKYLDVNKDGALAGDKVVDGTIGDKVTVGRVGSDGPSDKPPTYVCIKSICGVKPGFRSFFKKSEPGKIFFNNVSGVCSFHIDYLKENLKEYFVPETCKDNYYENFSRCSYENGELPPAKEDKVLECYQGKTGGVGLAGTLVPNKFVIEPQQLWEDWIKRAKDVKCSVIDDPNEDNIVEGFELEMMFDALNSVVFNKKDQISDKNIKKIIKTLFKKFNITVKD